MIVKQPISPLRIGHDTVSFVPGKPVPKIALEYWKKTGQIEPLMKAGVIGDESIRSSEKRQSGDSDKIGRTDYGDDADKSEGTGGIKKRDDKGKGN